MKPYLLELSEDVVCPICNDTIGRFSRGITFHARKHEIDSESLFRLAKGIVIDPTCKCKVGCEVRVEWKGWKFGYSRYANGHYDSGRRSENTKKRLADHHPMRGRTKETDEVLRNAAKKYQ